VTVASDELVPTELRLDGLQVWLPRIAVAVPPTIYLQRADGRFHRYRLKDPR